MNYELKTIQRQQPSSVPSSNSNICNIPISTTTGVYSINSTDRIIKYRHQRMIRQRTVANSDTTKWDKHRVMGHRRRWILIYEMLQWNHIHQVLLYFLGENDIERMNSKVVQIREGTNRSNCKQATYG